MKKTVVIFTSMLLIAAFSTSCVRVNKTCKQNRKRIDKWRKANPEMM